MSDTQPTNDTPTVRVLSQVPQMVKGPTGIYVDGRRITAQVNGRTTFVVDVPDSEYNVDTVRAKLAAEAEKVAAVDAIGY